MFSLREEKMRKYDEMEGTEAWVICLRRKEDYDRLKGISHVSDKTSMKIVIEGYYQYSGAEHEKREPYLRIVHRER